MLAGRLQGFLWGATFSVLFLTACGGDSVDTSAPSAQAIVASDRTGHFLDRPFPSDELLDADGRVDLGGFPVAGPAVGQNFMRGWLQQVRRAVRGFSTLSPIYFRTSGDPGLAEHYDGDDGDAVLLRSLDSDDRVPVSVRFVGADEGDPYLPANTLIVSPDERHPLRAGERYAAWVSERALRRAEGWSPPAELEGRSAAVATVFTVQDHVAELNALRRATDAFLDGNPSLLEPQGGLREVRSLRFEQGMTPSRQPATLEIVTFADGSSETTYLDDKRGAVDRTIDLSSGPMAVYQATIQTAAFQDPAGRPYQSPGIGIIFDTERTDGWIDFGPNGELRSAPHAEPMRIVVQMPRRDGRMGVIVWGHGSGGDAYEAVSRTDAADDIAGVREILAQSGALLVSLDQPLFGRRFPLIDRGYANNLAVVNIPNLPAFRDNVRQGAVDQRVALRFAREVLPDLLGDERVDAGRIGLFGHSIGAQIAGVGLALQGEDGPSAALINGTGGFVTHSVLASDLLALRGGDTANAIFGLAGIPAPEDPTPPAILGALLGLPSSAWHRLDRHHPLGLPFQLVVDAADPLAVAGRHPVPLTVFHGDGDTYVPLEGAEWIADASRDGRLATCTPSGPYDGHLCIFREPRGLEEFARLVDRL